MELSKTKKPSQVHAAVTTLVNKQQMKTVPVRSLSLPKGVPVPHFDTLKEVVAHFNGDELKAVDVLNKYGRQKDSLVNAREFLSLVVADAVSYKDGDKEYPGYNFPILDRKTKKPITGDAKKDDPETESDHLNRFVKAVVTGALTVKGFTVTGKDDAEKTKSVWGLLQTVIDAHGPFPFDLNESKRAGGKAKNPPKYATDAAVSIIGGGAKRVADWTKKFEEGYESGGYGRVEPIEFSPFNQVPPAGSTPEQIEALKQSNIINLAWAVAAVEEQKRNNQVKKEYV